MVAIIGTPGASAPRRKVFCALFFKKALLSSAESTAESGLTSGYDYDMIAPTQ